ncbi:hypothetical protein MIMGU_mgv1a006566mg [Erythranthe guttata]|uniref:Uncharacterized protein n=1 Tax=Erythranthe guttata TaxID=4155 RepID=A0A022S2D5_ERYGU|nr:hypothetical protein MIMGU_mgv1a006566mg [Erythranthe guttata]
MGCFSGCFGGDKDKKRLKQRINRASPQRQRNRVQNLQQENVITAEQSVAESIPVDLVPELGNKPEAAVQQLSPSPKKRVTFNSNITTYEHVPVGGSTESLPDCTLNAEEEKQEDLKATSSQSQSISRDDNSIASSVASYPPNHRTAGKEVWSESVITASMESSTENLLAVAIDEEVVSSLVKASPSDEEITAFGSKTTNARDRSDYINSALNPVDNITQWKVAKSKVTTVCKPQKENLTANFESPRISFSPEPTFGPSPSSFKSKSGRSKDANNQEIAVDASLSNWLASPEITTTPSKKTGFSGFEDRPILGALTVEELRQISATPSPRKSPSRSPDEIPIIGSVGTYWNHSNSAKRSDSSASSFKGIPNTTSKYREDKRVNWHSTPFETRLDRALNRGAAEA